MGRKHINMFNKILSYLLSSLQFSQFLQPTYMAFVVKKKKKPTNILKQQIPIGYRISWVVSY